MTSFGTIIGLTFTDANAAKRFIDGTSPIVPATSFGSTHSSAERRPRRATLSRKATCGYPWAASLPRCCGTRSAGCWTHWADGAANPL